MKMIFDLLKTSWGKLSFSIVLSVLAGVLYALSIKFLHQIITNEPDAISTLFKLLGCITSSTAMSIYSGHYLTKIYENQVSELRLSLSEKVLNSNFFHVEQNSLKILPVLNNDINTIGSFIKTVPDFFVSVSKIVACVAYMFWLSWHLTTYVLSIYSLVFLITLVIYPKLYKQERIIRGLKNDIFEQINGLIRGLKELTLNKKHKAIYVQEIMGPISRKHRDSLTKIGTLNIFATKLGELIVVVALSFIVIYFNSSGGFGNDLLLEFLTVVLFALPSMIIVTTFFNSAKKVEIALMQINLLGLQFDGAEEDKRTEDLRVGESKEALVSLKNVAFEYGSEREKNGYRIGDFNFDIHEGEIVYLSGGNGSGKTTLGKLIVGLYTPFHGSVSYKGQVVAESTRDDYRNRFSALFPDSHIFRSFKYIENDRLIEHAEPLIKLLKIEEVVNIKNKELSTIHVSSGQQGRLSLLRALLEDKDIYLFDEWAANQDPVFKKKFYCEIIPGLKKQGKTVIVITHDESYYHMADRVIKLEDGHVV